MTYLAIINTNTMKCENVTVDPRPADQVTIPGSYLVLDLATTPAIKWIKDAEGVWVQSQEKPGIGGVGMIWTGERLEQPKPADI
jgi:hypothetical protein